MDIAIVSGESRSTVGGLAAYNRRLAQGLVGAGARVTSVSRFDRDLPGDIDYGAGHNGAGRPVDGTPTRLIGPISAARPLLRQLVRFNTRPWLRPWGVRLFNAAYERSLAAAVGDGVDVVHYIGTGWDLLGFAALAVARRRRARFTMLPAVHPGSWGDSPLDVDLYRRADAVFVLSTPEAEHLVGLGVPRPLLVRTPLAPAVAATGNGRRFRLAHGLGDRPVVLFIARKLRSKGFHTTAEAMPAVLDAVPDACLVAIGPDGDEPYPPVRGGGYLDLGPTDDAEKADALAACDVLCMPSTDDSFGLVYVEAWACGKPVVGGPAPAVRELVDDGVTGLTLPEQRADLVAAAVVRLLADLPLRTRLGTAGNALQASRYSWPAVIDVHLRAFAQASPTPLRP